MMSERYHMPTVEPPRSRRGIALVLIGIGVAWLIGQTGVLHAALWSVLVPLLMLAVGIDLITAGGYRRRVITGALLAALVLVPLAMAAEWFGTPEEPPRMEQAASGPIVLGARNDVERVRAEISQTAGNVTVRALGADSTDVARLAQGIDGAEFDVDDGVGELNIDTGGWEGNIDLQVARDVPLDLSIDVDAGNADPIDLSETRLNTLDLRANAGNARVQLPAEGAMDVSIDARFGNVTIDVPRDLPATIVADARLGNIKLPERFRRQGDEYRTDGYNEDAANRVTIKVSASGGNITVNDVDHR